MEVGPKGDGSSLVHGIIYKRRTIISAHTSRWERGIADDKNAVFLLLSVAFDLQSTKDQNTTNRQPTQRLEGAVRGWL